MTTVSLKTLMMVQSPSCGWTSTSPRFNVLAAVGVVVCSMAWLNSATSPHASASALDGKPSISDCCAGWIVGALAADLGAAACSLAAATSPHPIDAVLSCAEDATLEDAASRSPQPTAATGAGVGAGSSCSVELGGLRMGISSIASERTEARSWVRSEER